MTTFVLAPAITWNSTTSPYATPRTMLEQHELRAYTQREDGSLRHLELAPLDSTRRNTAEWISEQLDAGTPVKAVARDLHISVATVRRFLLSLELTEQVEADEWEDLRFDSQGEPVWAVASTEENVAQEDDSDTDELHDVLGTACEPTGTTAEDLDTALRASLA